jgi:hypothetical protein
MKLQISIGVRWAALFAAATVIAGCGNKNDAVTQAKKKDVAAGVRAPSIEETKTIAEEGFVYGLPIVMNYAIEYAFAVDRDSGQFKAPFNQIHNEASVFTYKDTAVVTPNSDTPYSFLLLDLRAEPMVLSVPTVDKKRYYSVQLIDSNTIITAISVVAPPGMMRAITSSPDRIGMARPQPASKRCSALGRSLRRPLTARSS